MTSAIYKREKKTLRRRGTRKSTQEGGRGGRWWWSIFASQENLRFAPGFSLHDNSLLTGAHIVQRAHKKGLGEMGGQEAGNGPKFSFHFISSFGTLRDVVHSTSSRCLSHVCPVLIPARHFVSRCKRQRRQTHSRSVQRAVQRGGAAQCAAIDGRGLFIATTTATTTTARR